MIGQVVKRDGRIVPFDPAKITFAILRAAVAVGGRNQAAAEAVTNRVLDELARRYDHQQGLFPEAGVPPLSRMPGVEEIQDIVEKMLIECGHARTAKAYILYRYERGLKREGKTSKTYSSDNLPYRTMWESLTWAAANDLDNLQGLANWMVPERIGRLVQLCEDFYQAEMLRAGSALRERLADTRVIIVTGPSSSGKTTTAAKIARQLSQSGRRLVPLVVDNYFYDLLTHPQDSYGDFDFETPQSLELPLIDNHVRFLLDGKTVDIPRYDFRQGRRTGSSGSLRLEPGDILMIDSLHGLNPAMTSSVRDEHKFSIYLEPFAQMRDADGDNIAWTDIRMMRRMVRDMQFRNYDPRMTILHWYLVRRAELFSICPSLSRADVVVNTFHPYELGLWKKRLAAHFANFVEDLPRGGERSDARVRAERVHRLLSAVPAWPDESMVPGESLLREFLGGGTLDLH